MSNVINRYSMRRADPRTLLFECTFCYVLNPSHDHRCMGCGKSKFRALSLPPAVVLQVRLHCFYRPTPVAADFARCNLAPFTTTQALNAVRHPSALN